MTRKTLIVKPVQYKYIIINLLIVLISAAVLFYIVNFTISHSEILMNLSEGEIKKLKTTILDAYIYMVIVLLLGFGIESVILYHRLFGPLYKMQKMMKEIANGNLHEDMHFRAKDELKDFEYSFNEMLGGIRRRVTQDINLAEEISQKIDEVINTANDDDREKLYEVKEMLKKVGGDFKL